MKNKKAQAQIITVVLIILIVLAEIVIVWQVIKSTVIDEENKQEQEITLRDCLKKIAIKECNNRNMTLSYLDSKFTTWTFYCKEDPRETSWREYNFLKNEIDGCK